MQQGSYRYEDQGSQSQEYCYNQGSHNRQHSSGYHYDPHGGSRPRAGGEYHYNLVPQKPQRNGDWGDWVGMAVLFLIPSNMTKVIAVVWLLSKVSGYLRSQPQLPGVVKQGGGTAMEQAQGWTQPHGLWRKLGPGTVKMAVGGVMALVFGLGALTHTADFVESLIHNHLFSDDVMDMLVYLVACGVGVGMLASGLRTRKRYERYTNYLAYIGANRQVSLAPMAAAMDVSMHTLTRDLRKMVATHVLPAGYVDLQAGKLVLTELGYIEPEPEPEPEPEAQSQQPSEEEDAVLREIRLISDLIVDPVISGKIDRIEEITQKILQYQKNNPQRSDQLRTFLNYYLPTTLKILRAYARLDAQGVEGENITAAKQRIEGMMDQVVEGFEKQLDKLFHSDAMDITADIQVLENMLKKDGLSHDTMHLD